ncbi:MAG: hypothetical protein GWN01_12470, partial [Nitrosopumilaceae archaeon]|nr:hypothetical protein [Nitrosopumilaceae archaeon]NIX62290.1 hypothetical protein [Nitrosopumilaceae archaeon]
QIKVDEEYTIVKRDTNSFLKKNNQPFDLIFADPPFKWDEFNKMLNLVFKANNLSEYGLFVLESERSHNIKWASDEFEVLRQKQFDRSIISFASKKGVV